MSQFTAHPATDIGQVALRVIDLRRSIDFYTGILGFQVNSVSGSSAALGAGDDVLLRLVEEPDARLAQRTAGLYHFAILVPTRRDLARSIEHLATTRTPLQGFADHLVSEAVYLADPDGNGIEIYRDRPRDQWPRRDGQLLMATDPLDVNGLLGELGDEEEQWAGLSSGTRIGHIHLQVSDLAATVAFYQEILGFDLILRFGPSAAFLAAGGYHHHIGCNTWAGNGVPPAPSDAAGLLWFTVDMPDQAIYELAIQRLAKAAIVTERRAEGLFVRDPSRIGLLLRLKTT